MAPSTSSLLPILLSFFFQLTPTLQIDVYPPKYPTDPNAASDCIQWYDHTTLSTSPIKVSGEYTNGSCAAVRRFFSISPEEFHKWNPSVSIDCEPWLDYRSYCVRVAAGPSIGCFMKGSLEVEYTYFVKDRMDWDLKVESCVYTCKIHGYGSAGMQNGNQCWCGWMREENKESKLVEDQSECNVPCAGDESQICGGKNVLAVYDTGFVDTWVAPGLTATVSTTAGTSTRAADVSIMTGTVIPTSSAAGDAPNPSESDPSSDAMRHMAVSWSLGLGLLIAVATTV
ncbi:hypothetical protein B0T20DRAFT_348523 [Sordaria brevicollis]|uniref:WSC domain-containing protein n=1 Tax=Sordaria brevicollis TaxID=83679 RepID=A0AAE0PIJ5_SORBR|nr:hypothetical protein B0T20DRAFT_348523 [Sordaria brevicollis]